MNIEYRQFHGPSDWGWVKKKVPMNRVEDTHGIMAIDVEKQRTMGACIIDNVMRNSCQITLIMDSPFLIKHGFIGEIFDYIFNNLGLEYCYALIADSNIKSVRLCKHLGGVEKMRMPEGFDKGVDMIVFQIHRDDVLSWANVKIKKAA